MREEMGSSSEDDGSLYVKEESLEDSSWDPSNRRSAFSPYVSRPVTILTNLQRGNTETQAAQPPPVEITIHTKAAMGELLVEDCTTEIDLDEVDCNGLTPLMWAASYGQLPTVRVIIQKQATIDFEGEDGETALLLAAAGGHHEVVRMLLGYGSNANHADHMANTALMFAAHGDHSHCVAELIENGAEITLTNVEGDTAFNIAVNNASKQVQVVLERFILRLLEPS